ncbi:prolipoprotein diacylglyceryl transferase [Ahniella affigens]|uniref:Phosphatidylglycerol--prolipoprotein diacylglyceryl transferase n=1 Tax=Ahniella affigens TaxID=2021234 RepID=A0A2P1PX28_9GAMM|nr:prolipoprotein diacylglyceryl transferase [Ahniella affigens]AVP99408.1 prolipoprotein diacylglyceryl transferase [Ahniella affigens]
MAILHDIDPIALDLGIVKIHWYGLMYLAALGSAWWLGRRRVAGNRYGVNADQLSDLLFYGMIGVVVGGRVGYMLIYATPELLAHPLSLFKVWEGGMSFHGGLLGVMIACFSWSWSLRRHPFDTLDLVAPLVPVGLGFGRMGNFIGGELWGRHTDAPVGMIFPNALPGNLSMDEIRLQAAQGLLDHEARHPSQLYQAGLEGVVLFVLVWWFSSKPRPRYAVSGLFCLGYGVQRFIVEFFREPDKQMGYIAFDWVTTGQVLSLPMILFGLFLLFWSHRQKHFN